MTKAVLEADTEHDARRTVTAAPSRKLAVPPTLHASLMARLDRLGPAKEVAQIAAAIGRDFAHDLLASVARKPADELTAALDRLLDAELLFRHGSPPDVTYQFNHALVQDAAYGTLLRDARRTLHARIAGTLEQQFADSAERQPEVVARHLTEAGLVERAVTLWAKAGRRALGAIGLERGGRATGTGEELARIVAGYSGTPPRADQAPDRAFERADPYQGARLTRDQGVVRESETAHRGCRGTERIWTIHCCCSRFSTVFGSPIAWRSGETACELAHQFLDLARPPKCCGPTHDRAYDAWYIVGARRPPYRRAHTSRSSIALYQPAEHRVLATRFGHDVRMTVFCWRALPYGCSAIRMPRPPTCNVHWMMRGTWSTQQRRCLRCLMCHWRMRSAEITFRLKRLPDSLWLWAMKRAACTGNRMG